MMEQPSDYIKVHVRHSDCSGEYSLQLPDTVTVEQLKRMAIGHFLTNSQAFTSLQTVLPPTHLAPSPPYIPHYTRPPTTTAGYLSGAGLLSGAVSSSSSSLLPATTTAAAAARSNLFSMLGMVGGSSSSSSQQPQVESAGSHYLAARDYRAKVTGFSRPQLYSLLMVDQLRQLADGVSLAHELLPDEAFLLLVPHGSPGPPWIPPELVHARQQAQERGVVPPPLRDGPPPTEEDITRACNHLPLSGTAPPPSVILTEGQSKVLLRRILLAVAHSSLRLVGEPRVAQEAFTAIIGKLERRHKSTMRPESLQKLMDMGFSQPKAAMALKLKSTVEDAAEWLLDHKTQEHPAPPPLTRQLTAADDPVAELMPHFWHFRRRYFLPSAGAYNFLVTQGFDSTRVFDALMQTENDKNTALELLERELRLGVDLLYSPPERDNPIMAAIMASSVLQSALHKPKVLYALLALCENPNNANLWLSDPDTSGVVNLVLKVYHEERYNKHCVDAVLPSTVVLPSTAVLPSTPMLH